MIEKKEGIIMANVFISGATSDIGSATARLFAQEKHTLFLHYHENHDVVEKLKQELELTYQINVNLLQADFRNKEDLSSLCENLKKQHIDIAILNAATNHDTLLEEKTLDDFANTIQVNLNANFLLAKELGLGMKENKNGCILFVSSNNALDANYPESIDYDASKAGLISLMHNFALSFAPYVRVNTIAPGWVDTLKVSDMSPVMRKKEEDQIMLERFATPKEIADIIFFLCSNKASYINNTVIRIDGGLK